MHITHAIIAAIAQVRELQIRTYHVPPIMREGHPAYYWHTTDGVHYKCYALSLDATDTNICVSHLPSAKFPTAMRCFPPSEWCFIECAGVIVQSSTGLVGDDVVYWGDEEHFTVTLSMTAALIPN